jgi:hypothetical protein
MKTSKYQIILTDGSILKIEAAFVEINQGGMLVISDQNGIVAAFSTWARIHKLSA